MTTHSRAKMLRAIAEGGYSPCADEDGSTAHELEQWAKELEGEPSVPTMWEIVMLGLEWCIAPLLCPYKQVRRWRARLRLRRRLRTLGMLPLVLLAIPANAQSPDTLLTTVLVRQAIGEWRKDVIRPYCITFFAEKPDRPHLLMMIDVAPADTSRRPLCPDPSGGYLPVLVDLPECPPDERVSVTDRDWLMVRCGPNEFARYRRRWAERRAQ